MSNQITTGTIGVLQDFRAACLDAGLKEARRRSVVSHHDPTIRFTNSTISVLKPALLDGPVEPQFLLQPALRLRNLDHFTKTGEMSAYGCAFHAFGALLPPAQLKEALDLAQHFLTGAELPVPGVAVLAKTKEALPLVMRVSATDLDLAEACDRGGWAVEKVDAERPFRHVFGLEGVTGRNVNPAVRLPDGRLVDLGNVIVIERAGQVAAIEVAFGVNVVLMVRLGLIHPVQASTAADVIGPEADFMLLDALGSSALLCLDGLHPTSRGRAGRYRQLLQIVLQRSDAPSTALAEVLATVVDREAQVRGWSSPLHPGDPEVPGSEARESAVTHLLGLVDTVAREPR